MEKPHGRAKARRVLRMMRTEELLLQVNESTGDLDKPLVVRPIFVPALEPQMLEHIVCFIILTRVETGEKPGVARVQAGRRRGAKLGDKGRNALIFFHRAAGARQLSCAILCLTRCQ